MDIMATPSFSLPGRRIDGRRFLEVAYDLMIFRKFEDVLSMCHLGSSNGRSTMEIVFPQTLQGINGSLLECDSDPKEGETASGESAEIIWRRKFNESICILAIQAYAETDQWDRVHPFLANYYESQARYPPTIAKLCILLLAKVRNFTMAENLAGEWLANATNQTHSQYSTIMDILIAQILLPQAKLDQARAVVELSSGLSPEKKMSFLKYLEKVEEDLQMKRKITDTVEGSVNEYSSSAFMRVVQRISQLITRLLPATGLRYIRNIACLGFFIYLIVLRTNLASSTSLSHAAVLWSGIVRIWRSLFAPFHLMPKA
ncbi:peroxisome assembly protein 26-like [Acanthaster planci]|uniref:Peroxisome assembly protein 26-like n=1 Tax=Acanthaster planci TaxID=133434 RepID=A0A8B7Z250_ACAPL|nr:peroxisome assembly protein 26-like [Acanthaster planci]